MLTPRENMLRTIRCEEAEWIPIAVYLDPYNHPNPDTLPENLKKLFNERIMHWERRWELYVPLSEYLGIDEYILNSDTPYTIALPDGMVVSETQEDEVTLNKKDARYVTRIETSSGFLTQVMKSGFIIKHYIESPEDIKIFTEYVKEWKIEPDHKTISEVKRMKKIVQDNGIIWGFYEGTPLGMMYRFYADIANLFYMIADIPDEIEALFDIMERKYIEMFELTLKYCPEIDVIIGMDDTSTTVISPNMFEKYNVELTNKRVELAHEYGKLYMHHSCGLIHDLLPVYRKTKMDGVHAFQTPPFGNVTLSKGRQLLGNNISLQSGVVNGLVSSDIDTISEAVKLNMEEIRKIRHVITNVVSPDPNHEVDYMQKILEEARKYQKL